MAPLTDCSDFRISIPKTTATSTLSINFTFELSFTIFKASSAEYNFVLSTFLSAALILFEGCIVVSILYSLHINTCATCTTCDGTHSRI